MMPNCIEQTRVGCAIGGAYTALSMERVLPVLHAGSGCFATNEYFLGLSNGGQSSIGFRNGAIPGSNIVEEDVVFGAEAKLENLIRQSLDFYDADLIVVISGCTSAIIGDDVESVVSRFANSDIPVIHADAPGFKGSNIYGHHQVLNAIIDQYLPDTGEPKAGTVNIFGIIPAYDPYWAGTLDEASRILGAIGLEPNVIYGQNKGVDELKKIPDAAFNLVIGPWVDLRIVQKLERKYGTPYLHYPVFPIGPTETGRFIRAVADHAELDSKIVDGFIDASESEYYYYLKLVTQWMFAGKNIPKRFRMISTSSYALGFTKFLVNDIGFLPVGIYATDQPDDPDAVADIFAKELSELDGGIKTHIAIEDDPGLIDEQILADKEAEPAGTGFAYMYGSSWDMDLAADTASLFIPASPPNTTIIITRHYFGYRGALRLLEDTFNAVPNLG